MENKNFKSLKLRNGLEVPILGFGTTTTQNKNLLNETEECKEAIKYALEIGYRHIDTAKVYQNENVVGKAILKSNIGRQNIFITTKLHPDDYGTDTVRVAFQECLEKLGVDYIDLLLTHAPCNPFKEQIYDKVKKARLDTWSTMIELYNEGKCRAIGVSNYMPRHIQEIIDAELMLPLVNQCEFHPYFTNKENFDFCIKNGIAFGGYCPLARGAILKDEIILALANKYSKTPAQIAIKWSIQNNVVTIPGSWTHSRIKENFDIDDFVIDEYDLELISKLNKNRKVAFPDPTQLI